MTDEELIRMFRSDPTWMGQEVANRIEALAAHAEAMAQIVEAYRERAEALEKENTALKEHVAALLAEQDCGCGYDKPTDVCLGHLPLHRKTVARAERLEAALRKLHHAVCGETGFAACVRLDSGKAYPWPALDEADAAARAALKGDDHE